VTALWVTHRLEELAFADTASFMDNGRMQVRVCQPAGLPLGCCRQVAKATDDGCMHSFHCLSCCCVCAKNTAGSDVLQMSWVVRRVKLCCCASCAPGLWLYGAGAKPGLLLQVLS